MSLGIPWPSEADPLHFEKRLVLVAALLGLPQAAGWAELVDRWEREGRAGVGPELAPQGALPLPPTPTPREGGQLSLFGQTEDR